VSIAARVVSMNLKTYVDVHPSPGKHRVTFVCEVATVLNGLHGVDFAHVDVCLTNVCFDHIMK